MKAALSLNFKIIGKYLGLWPYTEKSRQIPYVDEAGKHITKLKIIFRNNIVTFIMNICIILNVDSAGKFNTFNVKIKKETSWIETFETKISKI